MHKNPELSYHEEKTHDFILSELKKLDKLEIKAPVGERGIVAKLKGNEPGQTIAFRADFDALPIQDEKTYLINRLWMVLCMHVVMTVIPLHS